MIRKVCVLLFALALWQGAFSKPAGAQAGSNCVWQFGLGSWEGIPFGWYDCNDVGYEAAVSCYVQAYLCAPVAGPAENPHKQCATPTNPVCSSPISLLTGDTYIEETDIRIPGLSGGLTLQRTWNSMWPATQTAYQIGPFGPNWTSNFGEQIFLGADHYIKYERGDGSFWSFGYSSYDTWRVAAPANNTATLVQGSSNWTLTFPNGEQRIFSIATGKLLEIIDRNGNTTQLSYDSSNRLITVTDPASRHLYFSYGSSTYLVATVTSDFGESVSYSYDSQGRLSQVTEPDGSTLSFQYDANSFISAVLDSNGKILEAHTYDSSGRGLTASRANGVDAVTLSYGTD